METFFDIASDRTPARETGVHTARQMIQLIYDHHPICRCQVTGRWAQYNNKPMRWMPDDVLRYERPIQESHCEKGPEYTGDEQWLTGA